MPDDQNDLLGEIRDLLRQQLELQKTAAAEAADYRKWASDAQELSHKMYREAAARQRRLIQVYLILIAVFVGMCFIVATGQLEAIVKNAANKAGIPEFVLPEDRPAKGDR